MDFESEGNQEGVMDSLMEALKTGSAFSRDQKRKRAARPAGGELLHKKLTCIISTVLLFQLREEHN